MTLSRRSSLVLGSRPPRPTGLGEPRPPQLFSLGSATLDASLRGGLAQGALHEIFARSTMEAAAATAFALTLAIKASGGRCLLWARQDYADRETGRLHAPGFLALGFDPARLILVRARDAAGVLRAGVEAARCSSLGAVVIEPWGEPAMLDLTVSRRLSLAAGQSGVTILMARVAARPTPSAASSRWMARLSASRPMPANAPGPPVFEIALLRHRAGIAPRAWVVEWDRDRCAFNDGSSLSRPLGAVPADRTAASAREPFRLERAG